MLKSVKNRWAPFIRLKKKLFRLWGSWYSNRPARTHGFNAKIGFEKYVTSPEILAKKCPKSAFQTKPAKFGTYWPISRDSLHIFQNRFLRWNRESEPVDLNTMNLIIRTFFFLTHKGVRAILSGLEEALSSHLGPSNFTWYLSIWWRMGDNTELISNPTFNFFEPP